MFFLKKHRCDSLHSGDYVECDEFGWWLTGFKPVHQTSDEVLRITFDGISVDGSNRSVPSCADADDGNSFVVLEESSAASREEDPPADYESGGRFYRETSDDDADEICSAEEPPCKASSRSYTPERLVRTQDYAIITECPNFSSTPQTEPSTPLATPCKRCANKRHRRLSHLIDQRLVGASQLEALLDPDALDVKVPVTLARRKVFTDNFPKESSRAGDLLAIANSDSPKRLLTPDLTSSGSSCERFHSDWDRYSGPTIGENAHCRSKRFRELNELYSSCSNSTEDLLGEGISSADKSCKQDSATETPEDPETVVNRLKGRIEHIRDINKDIFGDLSSLRKNFQWAEKKTGNLRTETTRLRQEIQDLRYLDDLVNLLRGELERISQRNWPFNLGHSERLAEEVNLVV